MDFSLRLSFISLHAEVLCVEPKCIFSGILPYSRFSAESEQFVMLALVHVYVKHICVLCMFVVFCFFSV